MTPIILIFLSLIVFGFLCRAIAIKRNRDKVFWFAMGVTFGPLALPFVLFTSTKEA